MILIIVLLCSLFKQLLFFCFDLDYVTTQACEILMFMYFLVLFLAQCVFKDIK